MVLAQNEHINQYNQTGHTYISPQTYIYLNFYKETRNKHLEKHCILKKKMVLVKLDVEECKSIHTDHPAQNSTLSVSKMSS